MHFHSYERELLMRLYKADGWFDLYSLHKELLLSPAQVSSSIDKLMDMELVELDGLSAKLTTQGRKWLLLNRKEIFMDVVRTWSKSEVVSEPTIAAGQPYMPRLRSISTDFFKKLD